MNVVFYTFNKRRNSTKRPSGSGTTVTCVLKSPTSVHDPVLELAGAPNVAFDYAYISAFGRYYFVQDIVSIANGLSEYHLTEDVLATHKTEIGNMRAFIQYASTGYDTMKIDSRIMMKNTKTKSGNGVMDNPMFNGGGFYLTVFNKNSETGAGSSGMSQTYLLDDSAMTTMRKWFADDTFFTALHNYFNGNPLDGVFSVKWMPYRVAVGSNSTKVYIGNRNSLSDGYPLPTGAQCYLLSGFPQITKTYKISRPNIYSDFRMYEPYTTGVLFLPGLGNLELNLGDWKGSDINISATIEVITGNVTYLLFTDNGALIQSASCNVASDCPIAKEVTNGAGVVSSIGATIGGAAVLAAGVVTGGASIALSGGAAVVAGVANTVLNSNRTAPSVSGNFGARGSLLWPYITLTETAVDTEDPSDLYYIAEKGRPVGKVDGIGSYSGYIQTIDAHIDCDGSAEEREEIENYLNSGIYYE